MIERHGQIQAKEKIFWGKIHELRLGRIAVIIGPHRKKKNRAHEYLQQFSVGYCTEMSSPFHSASLTQMPQRLNCAFTIQTTLYASAPAKIMFHIGILGSEIQN